MSHINNTSRPLIFLGCNYNMWKYVEICEAIGIEIAGIMDGDYYGNTEQICDVPIIDTEQSLQDPIKLEYYKNNYNFYCAVNWSPITDPVSIRNRQKRTTLIDLIETLSLECISIVAKTSYVPKSVSIGKGCFIDNMVHIESKVVVEDFTRIYALSHIGHHAHIGKNCVLQRMCVAPSDSTLGNDTYFAPMVKALKGGARFGENTWIQEGIYIRRNTIPNEIVSLSEGNRKRVLPSLDNCL